MTKLITKKRKIKLKLLFTFILLIIGIYASYKNIENKRIVINDKELTSLITADSFTYNNTNFIEKTISKLIDISNPINELNSKYQETSTIVDTTKKEEVPLIYLYNTHQSEEYISTTLAEYSVTPTVIMNNYILEDVFNKNGYKTIVEEESIKDILNKNNWKYYNSYKASRILLENSIVTYPTLKYFIDIHRDSLPRSKTTITINNKDYAKVLFINNKLNEKYMGLCKGILKKQGRGVNGVYNQDFNNKTILIEIGGYENTPNEVLNSALAFADVFMEIINEENN